MLNKLKSGSVWTRLVGSHSLLTWDTLRPSSCGKKSRCADTALPTPPPSISSSISSSTSSSLTSSGRKVCRKRSTSWRCSCWLKTLDCLLITWKRGVKIRHFMLVRKRVHSAFEPWSFLIQEPLRRQVNSKGFGKKQLLLTA